MQLSSVLIRHASQWTLFVLRLLTRLICLLLRHSLEPQKPSFKSPFSYGKQAVASRNKAAARHKKPDWIGLELLKFKYGLPTLGYKKLAYTFNLKHAGEMNDFGRAVSVSASYVGNVLRRRRHELALARTKACEPHAAPPLGVWGMDMTGLPLTDGDTVSVFGILDHGSRVCLQATPVVRYNSLILLGKLIQTMGEWRLPRAVRYENKRSAVSVKANICEACYAVTTTMRFLRRACLGGHSNFLMFVSSSRTWAVLGKTGVWSVFGGR